jgi:hypothetical protein
MTLDPQRGVFFAGTEGNDTAQVTVVDQTADPAANDTAAVTVGAPVKLFAPDKDALTPYGTIDLIATGGQPPY